MANEFKHKDPGAELTQAEFIAACGDGHIFACQATGDIVYASSATVLSKLAKGSAGTVLSMGCSCIPAWTTNAASATVASTVVVVDGTDTSSFVAIFDCATGSMAPKTDAGLAYNAGTGTLTATAFAGPITGNVTGDASGSALTVTQAAQGAITSLGTLTGLTLSGDATLTGAATDVDLIDNNACAISFDAAGQAGILAIDTQNCAEGVKMSGKLTVTGAISTTGAVTVGVDDTGHDVKFFGAAAGAFMLYDQSCDQLEIRGASADATTSTGKLLLSTSLTNVNANDVIGSINFQAPAEAGGTDAIAIAAGIRAVAQATFTCAVNATDLIFYTGHSEAATEKFRFTSQNEIGIAGANYGTDGQVLTSGGAGAAVAWEDAGGGAVSALNNATANELVTIGATTTELCAEANLTYDGTTMQVGGSAATTLNLVTTSTSVGVVLGMFKAACSTGGAWSIDMKEGSGDGSSGNQRYQIGYTPHSSGQYFFMWAANGAGAGSATCIYRIPLNQSSIDANTTWDDNAFDLHDDAQVLERAFSVDYRPTVYECGKAILKGNYEELIEMGVLRKYNDCWVGYNDQRMAALLAGGIYQTRNRLDESYEELKAEIVGLKQQVTVLQGGCP